MLEYTDFTESYSIDSKIINRYRKDGHILLKGVAPRQQIDYYRPFIKRIVQKFQSKSAKRSDAYGKAFTQVMNMFTQCERVRQFVLTRRFGQIAAKLMKAKSVRIYYDCALFKPAYGGHTPLHVDPYVINSKQIITMWMPLIDISYEMGSLNFLSGSHCVLDDKNISPKKYVLEAIKNNLPSFTYGSMNAGDATFHEGGVVHSAPNNPTNQTREVMTITYYAEPARIFDPRNNGIRKESLEKYFNGLNTGDLAEGPLHPRVYCENDYK